MNLHELLESLPGADDILTGLKALEDGHTHTREALLITIAAQRLRDMGLPVPSREHLVEEPEIALYEALRTEGGDAYLRYNALIQQLVSFARALEGRLRRGAAVA